MREPPAFAGGSQLQGAVCLGKRWLDDVAEELEVAVEIRMRPLLTGHAVRDELERLRVENGGDRDVPDVPSENPSVRQFDLLGQTLEGADERDGSVAVVDRLVVARLICATWNTSDFPLAVAVNVWCNSNSSLNLLSG